MSDFGAVPAAILSALNNALSLNGSQDGAINYEQIPADEFPFAMIYDPVKTQERGDFQGGVERTANPIIVVWSDAAIADVNAAVVLVEAELASDPTLGGLVEDCWVSVVGRDESVESDLVAAVFQIDTKGTV